MSLRSDALLRSSMSTALTIRHGETPIAWSLSRVGSERGLLRFPMPAAIIGGMPATGVIVGVSYGRALRISLNYFPVTFGLFFGMAFLGIALGVSDSRFMLPLLLLPFVAVPLWLMPCAVVVKDGNAVEIVNPIRRVTVEPSEVTAVKLHTFRLGKDTCPAIVTSDGRRVAVVAATGQTFDLAGWRSLTS